MSTTLEMFHVLHVDDEPDFADTAAAFLEREDGRLTVTTATSVTDGLELVNTHEIDCIVSDYDMPGMNGIEFLETVREECPEIPFILFTGKGSEEVASDAISAGVTDYLQKGRGTDQYAVLANRVSNAVEHYRSRRMVERSERRLREIIDALPHPLYVVSENGEYLLASESLASFHGTTVDELEGTHIGDVLDDPVADRLRAAFGEVLDSGTRKQLREIAITDASGEEHVFEPHLLPYEFSDADEPAVLGVAVDVTERQQREAELERSRERVQIALECTDSVVFEIDLDTGEASRHGAYEQFFDLLPSDAPTWEAHLERAVHPEDRERFRRFYGQVLDGERESGTLEYRTHPGRGDVRWIRDTVAVRTGSADGTNRAVGIARDVTEHKERELELRRKERRYRAVFNDPNILAGLIDTDGTVLDINRTAMEYVEPTLEEIRGEPLRETPWVDPSADVQRAVGEWIDRAANGEYVEFEADRARANGAPYTVEGVFRPVVDDDGAVVSLLVSERDITERKERERELEETNALLSTLIETLPVGVLAENESRTVVAANERLFELFGMPGAPEEDVGADCERLAERVSDMFVESGAFVDRIDEVVATQESTDNEELALRDGRVFERSHRSIELPEGESHLWLYRDITERRERKRTLERERDRLDELANVLSHDLRTLLNVAEARLELAREERDSEHLDVMDRALDRMERITGSVLWLAGEGRDIGSVEPVALRDAVTTSWELVADDADRAELQYASDDRSLPPVEADDDRLRQLLENLFANAIEHGGEGVTVTVGTLEDGFYVEDDGPGVPEADRAEVFEAGYTTSEDGTGFGLRIAEQAAEAHGWEMRLAEGADGGARFEVTGVRAAS